MVDFSKLPGIVRPQVEGLNRVEDVAEREHEAAATMTLYPDPVQPDIIISIDIEALALGPRPVITEIAMLGYDLAEDSLLDQRHVHFYPIEPQQRILPPREIHASSIIWGVKSGNDYAKRLEQSSATEFEDLASLCRNFITVFNQLTNNGRANYEVVCARPQFDIVAIETLLLEVGLEKPWSYDSIIDVRTMLKRAGINHKNVPLPSGCIPHTGFGDARWQIAQYVAAIRGAVSK